MGSSGHRSDRVQGSVTVEHMQQGRRWKEVEGGAGRRREGRSRGFVMACSQLSSGIQVLSPRPSAEATVTFPSTASSVQQETNRLYLSSQLPDQVPGPRSLVPGPWSLVPGPRSQVPGPWSQVPGPRSLVPVGKTPQSPLNSCSVAFNHITCSSSSCANMEEMSPRSSGS